ncbi:MAG: radical SAM/Cys-rich domain protein [Chlorobi bacterium]|nr:radical SAM/Cys-rich domain protein [Chlorobiota bacterium]
MHFEEALSKYNLDLDPLSLETLQVNVGRLCNQACKHCHVDAGPARTEIMDRKTIDRILDILRDHPIANLDITGGAPELNPHFRYLVESAKALGKHVMVRCNLTVLFEPGLEDLVEFYVRNAVEIVSSLPYFQEFETDTQRGKGVFEKSIKALRMLNDAGYGQEDSGLLIDLVYNPVGAFLPPPQESLEREFKRELDHRYGITFNRLFTITNMPISRFLHFLQRTGNYETYMEKLVSSFNPAAAEGVMCRSLISVGYDGRLYDCDFNQMLDLNLNHGAPHTILDFDFDRIVNRRIVFGDHCFGCTAGAGSSCGGATA